MPWGVGVGVRVRVREASLLEKASLSEKASLEENRLNGSSISSLDYSRNAKCGKAQCLSNAIY